MLSIFRSWQILLLLITAPSIQAQSKNDQSIDVAIGLGISVPYDEVDVTGNGFYAQAEYVYSLLSWIDLRPYTGLVLTYPGHQNTAPGQPEYKATAQAFLMGGKIRIIAPIPWVAPYLEGGVGASLGSFQTFTPYTHIKDNGLSVHIPFSIGLMLGRNHNLDLAFTYYYHPTAAQFSGAMAVGFSFPLIHG